MARKQDADGSVRVHIILDAAEVQAIDDYGFANRIRTRSETIRTLIRKALASPVDETSE